MEESEAKKLAQERRERRAKKRYEQNKLSIEKAKKDLEFRISRRTLKTLDSSMKNFKEGKASEPIKLE
jgi:hypothetical protein